MKLLSRIAKAFYDLTFYTRGGYYTWVAVGVTVVGATASAVQANQQKKSAQGAAGAAAKQQEAALKSNVFRPPTLPQYVPFNFDKTQAGAINQDIAAYQRSDADFKTRHAPLVQAEKLFEAQTLKDQQGESELMPAIQSEFMRAGIGNSLSAFGGGTLSSPLAPGSAGEAAVARNLGSSIADFQDRNRGNRERSLTIAEDLFPRREFGMSGKDFVSSAVSDVQNQNAFNAAQYEREFQANAAKVGQQTQINNAQATSQNAMAAAQAQADAARTQAIIGAATTALSAGAKAYGQSGASTSVSGAVRPTQARYPGSQTWVPVGKYYA